MLLISQISSTASPENTHLMKAMDAIRIFHTTIFEKVSLEPDLGALPYQWQSMTFSFWNTTLEWINSCLSQSICNSSLVKQKGMGECVHTHCFFPSSAVASRCSFHSRGQLYTKGLSKISPDMKLLPQIQLQPSAAEPSSFHIATYSLTQSGLILVWLCLCLIRSPLLAGPQHTVLSFPFLVPEVSTTARSNIVERIWLSI